jgi:pyrroloquinoline-quinone synthase
MIERAQSPGRSRFIDELLSILRENPYRDPMLEAVRKGSMSPDGLRLWTLQAALVVRHFTRFISAIHANCPHRDGQQLLAENLWEEHGRGVPDRDHYSLILRLARSLGATDRDLDNVEPLPETDAYIKHCLNVTRQDSFVESLTAIAVGIEIFMPAFFGTLAESLRSKYGLTSKEVEYLLVHVTEDKTHSSRALQLIDTYAETDEVKEKAKAALRTMLVVKRQFAEALFKHCSSTS